MRLALFETNLDFMLDKAQVCRLVSRGPKRTSPWLGIILDPQSRVQKSVPTLYDDNSRAVLIAFPFDTCPIFFGYRTSAALLQYLFQTEVGPPCKGCSSGG
jgi:hypothetical protein